MMRWPWSSSFKSDEELKRKDQDVESVRDEVDELVKELRDVVDRVERRLLKGTNGRPG